VRSAASTPSRPLHCPLLPALLAACATACGEPGATDILQLTELNPRQVEVGDQLEITAQNFPAAADIRRISVTLRGTLARPGRPACNAPVEVTVSDPPAGATTYDVGTGTFRPLTYAESTSRTLRLEGAGRLVFPVTESLLAELTRCPGASNAAIDVSHATLSLGATGVRGAAHGVTVRIEGLGGTRAIAGTLRGPVLDLYAPPARRLELEVGARQRAERTLDFMGIALAPGHPTEGGLRVASVRVGSPADRAGIVSNDVLTRLDGLNVLALEDFVPASTARAVTVTTLRGAVQDDHVVSLDGYAPTAPLDLVAAAIVLAVVAALLGGFLFPKWDLATWLAVPLRARAQRGGFAAWLARGLRDALRTSPGEGSNDPAALRAAPWLLLAAVGTTLAFAPFGQWLVHTGLDVGALYALATSARLLAALLAGGGDVGQRWSPFGGVRAALRFLPCGLPALASIGCVVAMAGTLRVQGIVVAQGGYPWEWFAFRTPAAPVMFVLYALAVLGAATDVGEAPAREGPPTLAARLRAVWIVAEWLNVFALSALGSVLFLGGWQLPGVSFAELETSVFLQMLGAALLLGKAWACVFAVLWFRWALPRALVADALARCWRHVVAGVVLACGTTAAWLALVPRVAPVVPPAVGAGTFALCALSILWVLARPRVLDRRDPAWTYVPDPFR
jgi:NADH-quinone oxidoreductase subunit H